MLLDLSLPRSGAASLAGHSGETRHENSVLPRTALHMLIITSALFTHILKPFTLALQSLQRYSRGAAFLNKL